MIVAAPFGIADAVLALPELGLTRRIGHDICVPGENLR
jgi:hypothetical protein